MPFEAIGSIGDVVNVDPFQIDCMSQTGSILDYNNRDYLNL